MRNRTKCAAICICHGVEIYFDKKGIKDDVRNEGDVLRINGNNIMHLIILLSLNVNNLVQKHLSFLLI